MVQEKSFCSVSSVQVGATHMNASSGNDFVLYILKWDARIGTDHSALFLTQQMCLYLSI